MLAPEVTPLVAWALDEDDDVAVAAPLSPHATAPAPSAISAAHHRAPSKVRLAMVPLSAAPLGASLGRAARPRRSAAPLGGAYDAANEGGREKMRA
jgi:hypothetical protein